MKIIRIIFLMCFAFALQSQYQGPDGNNYTDKCDGQAPFANGGIATVWFNDSDGDCISNDFVIRLLWPDGVSNVLPGTGGTGLPINFGENPWQCCNEEIIGGLITIQTIVRVLGIMIHRLRF